MMVPKVWNRRYPGVPDDAVSIERGTEWGNPFRIGQDGTRKQVIAKYRERVLADADMLRRVQTRLRGRDLVCCCKPKPCHGDVLLELANARLSIQP